ncbi:hypothetical protein YWIDRAFT_08258 [Streptomyces sp. SceaMP-e96]|uniref:hypothetical protein n=1 Tax=Streptomyces TaxID=1883 RepID=UPI000823A0BA|nr:MULTISPECIES: hypothetical protein [unclassified Streptomyces]MYT18523.1 hypothetical protein [Streptomyces sp. SID4951]SCK57235.1 hypothetical protein YWIDRAFT_08258 [Streptomyces sp. SceaMP-e96]
MVVYAIPHGLLGKFAAFFVFSFTIALAALTAGPGHAENPTAQNRTVRIIRVSIVSQGPPDTAASSVITARQCAGAEADPTFFPEPFVTVNDIPGER